MGLFDWLFGKRHAPASGAGANVPRSPRRDRPRVIAGLNENGPHLLVENAAGQGVTVMDREMFDYLYEESNAPSPAQRDLDDLLPSITRVRAIASAMFRGRPLGSEVVLDTSDPEALAEFRHTFRIDECPATFTHCACLGGPTLELYAGEALRAVIGLHHGHSIRRPEWRHDARLVDGAALTAWLKKQGLEAELLDLLFHNQYDAGGMMPIGFQREGPSVLSRSEQRLRLAEVRRARGDLPGAWNACQAVLEEEPDLAFGYAIRALVRSDRGDLAGCVTDCTRAIQRGLKDVFILQARAMAQAGLGHREEALADLTAALEREPQQAAGYVNRGSLRAQGGQLEEAIKDFSEAIRLSPEWPVPLFYRAQAHYQHGQLAEAIADYDRLLPLLPEAPSAPPPEGVPPRAQVHCLRGEAHFDLFQEDEADADFAEAQRLIPAEACSYLGQMWLRRGQFDRAGRAFQQVIVAQPTDARGHLGCGLVLLARGELEAAAASFARAGRLDPDGHARRYLAQVHLQQGRGDEALTEISEHLQRHPDDTLAYQFRSHLHKLRQERTQALADLKAAHRLAPGDPVIINSLAWALATCPEAKLRDGRQAVALARQLCAATEHKVAEFVDTLAAACAEAGAFEEAVLQEDQALALVSTEARAVDPKRIENYQARRDLYLARQPYRE